MRRVHNRAFFVDCPTVFRLIALYALHIMDQRRPRVRVNRSASLKALGEKFADWRIEMLVAAFEKPRWLHTTSKFAESKGLAPTQNLGLRRPPPKRTPQSVSFVPFSSDQASPNAGLITQGSIV